MKIIKCENPCIDRAPLSYSSKIKHIFFAPEAYNGGPVFPLLGFNSTCSYNIVYLSPGNDIVNLASGRNLSSCFGLVAGALFPRRYSGVHSYPRVLTGSGVSNSVLVLLGKHIL